MEAELSSSDEDGSGTADSRSSTSSVKRVLFALPCVSYSPLRGTEDDVAPSGALSPRGPMAPSLMPPPRARAGVHVELREHDCLSFDQFAAMGYKDGSSGLAGGCEHLTVSETPTKLGAGAACRGAEKMRRGDSAAARRQDIPDGAAPSSLRVKAICVTQCPETGGHAGECWPVQESPDVDADSNLPLLHARCRGILDALESPGFEGSAQSTPGTDSSLQAQKASAPHVVSTKSLPSSPRKIQPRPSPISQRAGLPEDVGTKCDDGILEVPHGEPSPADRACRLSSATMEDVPAPIEDKPRSCIRAASPALIGDLNESAAPDPEQVWKHAIALQKEAEALREENLSLKVKSMKIYKASEQSRRHREERIAQLSHDLTRLTVFSQNLGLQKEVPCKSPQADKHYEGSTLPANNVLCTYKYIQQHAVPDLQKRGHVPVQPLGKCAPGLSPALNSPMPIGQRNDPDQTSVGSHTHGLHIRGIPTQPAPLLVHICSTGSRDTDEVVDVEDAASSVRRPTSATRAVIPVGKKGRPGSSMGDASKGVHDVGARTAVSSRGSTVCVLRIRAVFRAWVAIVAGLTHVKDAVIRHVLARGLRCWRQCTCAHFVEMRAGALLSMALSARISASNKCGLSSSMRKWHQMAGRYGRLRNAFLILRDLDVKWTTQRFLRRWCGLMALSRHYGHLASQMAWRQMAGTCRIAWRAWRQTVMIGKFCDDRAARACCHNKSMLFMGWKGQVQILKDMRTFREDIILPVQRRRKLSSTFLSWRLQVSFCNQWWLATQIMFLLT